MTATDALTHAVYLDRTATGAARIAVTYARKGRRGGGRRIMSLAGRDRDVAYPHIAAILWNYYGKRLRTVADDLPPGEYHAVSELCAAQMLLAMEVVKAERDAGRAQRLAAEVANMGACESAWWYACHRNRSRPRRVLRAMALMYA